MLVDLISKLVTTITIKKVVLWTLALLLGGIAYTAYERRADIFKKTGLATVQEAPPINPVGLSFSVGNTSKNKISNFVQENKEVVGMIVLSVDIRQNVRIVTHFYADPTSTNPAAFEQLETVTRIPLFTKNEENNRQMIKLINGEFSCTAYNGTLIGSIVPEVTREILSICRASLPPYYGHFSGFVAVLLNTDPSVDMQVRLKQSVEALATEVYFRDVIPTSKRINLNK